MIDLIIGVVCGIIIYVLIIYDWAEKTCLINSHECVKIRFQHINGTALINDMVSGTHIWFDGKDALLYGEPTGKICEKHYDSVFVWDIEKNKPRGYLCAKSLDTVKRIYKDSPIHYISHKSISTLKFLDLINLLMDLGIIYINF